MSTVKEGDLLWRPLPERAADSHLRRYLAWLEASRGLRFEGYHDLWQWSVTELETFWETIWQFFLVRSPTPYRTVLEERRMPGAVWFPGARLNYAREVLSRARAGGPVIEHRSELRGPGQLTRTELVEAVTRVSRAMTTLGVLPGDRVVGYLPNLPETVIALLASTAIGAIWSCCSPDFGTKTVLDRFQQLEPKLLIAVDGYRFGGKDFDRRGEVARIGAGLRSLEHSVLIPYLDPGAEPVGPAGRLWRELADGSIGGSGPLEFADTGFDDPLWVVFTSGTTGLPKGIVHGHGGVVIEMLKTLYLQANLSADSVYFFYTTSGWINFNILVTGLISGATIVLYDGHPAVPIPDLLWKMVDQLGVTNFGASPGYVQTMLKAGIRPRARYALERLKSVALTGAPVNPDHFAWFYRDVKDDFAVTSHSGGTEVCTGFFVSAPTEPVFAGEMQVRGLGIEAQAFDDQGRPLIDQIGELVITKPMPSMPLRFWNDVGDARYLDTYFDRYPGVWRHGDLVKITPRGTSTIYGRSDSTLNRYGVRIGTSDIYRIVESLGEVRDSLVINIDLSDEKSLLLLFVVLAEGDSLTADLIARIQARLREDGSPRHVPDMIHLVPAIPYTITGKKMEVPVKKLFLGVPVEKALSRDAMANPAAIERFVTLAAGSSAAGAPGPPT